MTMSDDKLEKTEFTGEDTDVRVTLSYNEMSHGKDEIYVRVYDENQGDFEGYRFKVEDERNRKCYYATNAGPKPAIQAVEALSEAGWQCTNFPLKELREEYKEETRKEFQSILKKHLELYQGIGGAGVIPQDELPEDANPEQFEELAGAYAIDTESEVVQKVAREVTARIWLLDWLIETQVETGYTVSELLGEEEAPDSPDVLEEGLSFNAENRLLAKEVVEALTSAMEELGYDSEIESNNPLFEDIGNE